MRNNRGVTLVALVITIIVLLILAGVSLAMLTGDSGILTNADEAKEQTLASNAENAIQMAYMDIKTEVYALETKNSSVQAVDMTAAKMKEIAKKYITFDEAVEADEDAGIEAVEGVTYTETEKTGSSDTVTLKIEYPDHVKVTDATITYDPTPATAGDPRVKLEGGKSTAAE